MTKQGTTLNIGGISVAELAKRYGTPLYVYHEGRIRENVRRLFAAFRSRYQNFDLFYAIKANSNPAIAAILVSEGTGV
ncbi:MAG: diaminopimelate decarboxylase, partial [Deltaproteobacteria bacterium]|nr:diaminopimelate decarboxylase [Deltaproteobacteria bacterium]